LVVYEILNGQGYQRTIVTPYSMRSFLQQTAVSDQGGRKIPKKWGHKSSFVVASVRSKSKLLIYYQFLDV
jgi:hypothetical protein